MADPQGARLYVNLSASQARKRLKGFGHGVRKVQSAGKNRAAIIHTATGRHLDELAAKFADVGSASRESELGQSIENLRNIGAVSGAWLQEAGIGTTADLKRLGPALAYRLVKQRQSKTSLNLLWAMAAGLADKDWRELTKVEKEELLLQIEDE
jgi:DNA transformation protein